MRRWLLVFSLGAATACLDDELTLGEACVADEECLGDQICGRTQSEIERGLAGVCVNDGDPCVFGEQIGCVCDAGTLPGIEDDSCYTQPPRYQVNAQIFITCDKTEGSPTYGQCIIDPSMGS